MKHFRIAIVFPGFGSGGVPVVMLALAREFLAQGNQVDLVVWDNAGPRWRSVPENARLVSLQALRSPFSIWRFMPKKKYRRLAGIAPLSHYFDEQRPDIVLSGGNYLNFMSSIARARANFKPKLVVAQHSTFSLECKKKPFVRWMVRRVCASPEVDAYVAVSNGVADDLSVHGRLPRHRITTIYNPVFTSDLVNKSKLPISHSWLNTMQFPVFLAVGRLNKQKDFQTLINAFARLRARHAARLVILGEGQQKSTLTALINHLNLADDVDLPGFADNPYAYMSRASAFVLSSAWEGFPTVLIEALACGCPIISTDCQSGPAEALANGRYGRLVPVGDADALAVAMEAVLKSPGDADARRTRATQFSTCSSAKRYLELFHSLRKDNA